MADFTPSVGLPAAPSAEDFYAETSKQLDEQAVATDVALDGVRQIAQQEQAVGVDPQPPADPYAPYREMKGASFDVYAPDGKGYRENLDDLLAKRDQQDEQGNHVADYTTTVIDPRGQRVGVALRDLDAALAQGAKLETAQQGETARYLEEHKGLSGTAIAAMQSLANQGLMGVPEIAEAHADPEKLARLEALKAEHEYASALGGVTGFGLSTLYAGPLLEAGGLAGDAVTSSLARVLQGRAAAAGAELAPTVAKSFAQKLVESGIKSGFEVSALAAPAAITEAALGDPSEAAEHLVWNFGAGLALGGLSEAGKSLFSRVFKGVPGVKVGLAEERAAEAEANAVGNPAAEQAGWDARFAKAHPEATGPGTKAVDAAGEAYINQQKSLKPEERDALRRVLREEAAHAGKQEDMLNATSRSLKRDADTALREGEDVLNKIAFGDGKAKEMAELVDQSKWQTASSVVQRAQNRVEEVVEELEGLADKGGSAGDVNRMRKALEAFKQKALWSREAGQPSEEIVRDSFMYLDKLKRDIGKSAAMGASEMQRTFAEKAAYDLYHELIPMLEDESAWGAAGAAQKAVNSATAFKLSMNKALRASFQTNIESQAGNAITEFDTGKLRSYLSRVLSSSTDEEARVLDRWVEGLGQQIDAVEKVLPGAKGKAGEFGKAREALKRFSSTLAKSKEEAAAVETIRRMQADERAKGMGGLFSLATDFFTKPMTVIERVAHARQYAARAEKAGILVTEQAQKVGGQRLDKFEQVLRTMGRAGSLSSYAARGAVEATDTGSGSRRDRFRAMQNRLADAQSNLDATNGHLAKFGGALEAGGAPNISREFILQEQRRIAYLASQLPKAPPPTPFGPKREYEPTEREIAQFERKEAVSRDPIGTITRAVARGTLTKDHLDAARTLYPGIHRKIGERAAAVAADPKSPALSSVQRMMLSRLVGQPAAKPSDKARYQDGYRQGSQQQPKPGPSLSKMPSPQTDFQRVSGG